MTFDPVVPPGADDEPAPNVQTLSARSPVAIGSRYEFGQLLGRGGMSTVYRAFDANSRQQVAVKVFHPGIELADSTARHRREVALASSLHHPGIVTVLDADIGADGHEGCAYLVTELVDGPTLAQRIKRSAIGEQAVADMGAALCDALAYIHQAGIIHRDIKPANVLLPGEDDSDLAHPKLADFGIAFMVDSTRMTATGLMTGTANYLSPEQVRGETLTSASDIYALGLVLIEALTGTPAFAGRGIEAAFARLRQNPQLPPAINRAFAAALARMTSQDPATRPTAASAAAELADIANGNLTAEILALDEFTTLPAPTAAHRQPEPPPALRPTARPISRAWVRAAAIAVLAAALGIGVTLAATMSAGNDHAAPLRPQAAAAQTTHSPTASATAATPSSSARPSARASQSRTGTVQGALAATRSSPRAAPTPPAPGDDGKGPGKGPAKGPGKGPPSGPGKGPGPKK
jgi:serine/threonine protein kinase